MFSESVEQQIGHRMPSLAGLEVASRPGLWAAVVGRDSVAAVLRVSRAAEEEFVASEDTLVKGPRALEDAATLRRMCRWQFGA